MSHPFTMPSTTSHNPRDESNSWKLLPIDVPRTQNRSQNPRQQSTSQSTSRDVEHPIDSGPSSSSGRGAGMNKPPEKRTSLDTLAALNIDVTRIDIPETLFDTVKSIFPKTPSLDNDNPSTSSIAKKSVAVDKNNGVTETSSKSYKSKMRIKEENDSQLIKCVEAFPNIYDRNNADFNITKKKQGSWNVISNRLGISVSDCQSRWKSLRAQYSRARKRPINLSEKSERLVAEMNFVPYIEHSSNKLKKGSGDTTTDKSQDCMYFSTNGMPLIRSLQPNINVCDKTDARLPPPHFSQSAYPSPDNETLLKIGKEYGRVTVTYTLPKF